MKYTTIIIGCQSTKVPKKRLGQYKLDNKYEFKNNELNVSLNNTLQCPVRIWILSNDKKLETHFDQVNPLTLSPLKDTIITIETNGVEDKAIKFTSRFGDINKTFSVRKVRLPHQKNKAYRLVQGYNSTPTHNTDWSRYALDFGLAIGDTICSATQANLINY